MTALLTSSRPILFSYRERSSGTVGLLGSSKFEGRQRIAKTVGSEETLSSKHWIPRYERFDAMKSCEHSHAHGQLEKAVWHMPSFSATPLIESWRQPPVTPEETKGLLVLHDFEWTRGFTWARRSRLPLGVGAAGFTAPGSGPNYTTFALRCVATSSMGDRIAPSRARSVHGNTFQSSLRQIFVEEPERILLELNFFATSRKATPSPSGGLATCLAVGDVLPATRQVVEFSAFLSKGHP